MIVYRRGKFIIRDAVSSDLDFIKNNVREIDQIDVEKLFGMSVQQSMASAYMLSTHKFTVMFKNEIVAVLGLIPETLISNRALVWMVTTRTIYQARIAFLRASRSFLNYLLSIYPKLYGNVRTQNDRSFDWLSWLGANLVQSELPICHVFTLEAI